MVLLFGAELTFAYQNEKTFAMERLAAGASYAYKEALGIWTMAALAHRFDAGMPPLTATEAAKEWGVPTRLLNDTFETLEAASLAQQTATDPPAYLPARSPERMTLQDVVNAMREHGRDPSPLREAHELEPILAASREARLNGPGKKPLAEIAGEVYARWQRGHNGESVRTGELPFALGPAPLPEEETADNTGQSQQG